MTGRILLAGVLGGIAMFIWTSLVHMVLPLGEAGVRELPDETPLLSAMESSIKRQPGLYIFPGTGLGRSATSEQKKEAMREMGQSTPRTRPVSSFTIQRVRVRSGWGVFSESSSRPSFSNPSWLSSCSPRRA